jgi:hypothetical protein
MFSDSSLRIRSVSTRVSCRAADCSPLRASRSSALASVSVRAAASLRASALALFETLGVLGVGCAQVDQLDVVVAARAELGFQRIAQLDQQAFEGAETAGPCPTAGRGCPGWFRTARR